MKKIIGKGYKKIDGMAITTGKPVYTDDLAMKDALVIKMLRSPHAFARIKNIDTSKAEALDGVECVLTYKDVSNVRFTLAGQSYPEPSPYDRLILEDIVRYVGDEVALVAAKDEKTAKKALSLIKVEYEVLEPVIDFEEAIDNKSIIHPEENLHCNFDIGHDKSRNIATYHKVEFGSDVEEELAKCDVVVEETYYTQAQAQAMMETFRSFCYLDHTGRLIVVSSTQIPFHVRRHIARALEIPASKVRVIKPRIGGGFGAKQTAAVEIFNALVTLRTGKPSKIVYDRQETFSCTTSRHAMRIKVRMGASNDGTIRVVDMEALSDTGAYGEHAPTVFAVAGQKSLPLYNKAVALRYHGHAVYTNKMPAGALRGYGATQGTFAQECAVNELAHKLGMDPTELRLKNLIKEGESTIAYGKTMASSTLDECIRKGKQMIGWDEKFPSKQISDNKVRAVGMAVTMQGSGIANIDTASADIKLNDDGTYTLYVGSTDMGTGSDTILAQMAAQTLKTQLDNITVCASDTDISPYDPGSYASSTTYVTGMAVVRAAEELISNMKQMAAKKLDVSELELVFDGEKLSTSSGKKSISLQKLSEELLVGTLSKQLSGSGTYGSPVSPPPFVAGFAEIELDKETGKFEVVDYVAVVDCGTVINPNLARIQVEGGIAQGIGMAMYEDVVYTSKGRMVTDSFMQYKIPCREDIRSIRVDFEESHEPTGPFGAKSVGEVVINTPPPAVAAAIYNACGVNVRQLPITAEKVFVGMNAK